MNKTSYFTLWGGLFILCAGLGFIPAPTGFLTCLMTSLSIVFFVPPACLLYRAIPEKDVQTVRLIRNLSIAALSLTLLLLIANFLCLMAPEAVGNFLYVLLVIVSCPMICSQYWVLSIFLWATLMMVSLNLLKKPR